MSINDISIDENNEKEKGREGEGGEVGESETSNIPYPSRCRSPLKVVEYNRLLLHLNLTFLLRFVTRQWSNSR